MTSVPLSADRRGVFKREEFRDLGGVAVGVAAAALLWAVFLSVMRLLV
jgi:hypothetical protein